MTAIGLYWSAARPVSPLRLTSHSMWLRRRSPLATGEVGVTGVHIGSLADMERLFEGIPLEKVRQIRTTANAIGPIVAAMYIAAFEKRGVNIRNTRMFIQNDILKEYIARGTYIFPPEAGVKLSSDVIEYCARNLPAWTPLAMSGYHIRDRGSTATRNWLLLLPMAWHTWTRYCAEG